MMQITAFPPPKPEIQYLKALLRLVEEGKLRIPAFQRRFVWTDDQIIDLLESVVSGYPIGSLLFWEVSERILKVQTEPLVPFPNIEEKYPLQYVLDGLQRLSTLYGVFHADKTKAGPFNVMFDLGEKIFKHYETGMNVDTCIFLADLFSPKNLLESQARMSQLENGDELISASIQLQTAFQEYSIPTVSISNRSVQDVVAMFHRINSKGTRLSAVDFMRALTWSEAFDLNHEIDKLRAELQQKKFDVGAETLVKVIAVMDGKDPNPSSMLALRDSSAADLHKATTTSRAAFDRVIDFVGRKFNVYNSEFIAYELQLLALVSFFRDDDSTNLDVLRKWITITNFNEELRGKPENYVSNVLKAVRELKKNPKQNALQLRLKLSADDLLEKKFIRNKALSAGFACLFAQIEPRSLVTGEPITADIYMQEFDGVNFSGLLTVKQLQDIRLDSSSNKLLANLILVLPGEIKLLAKETAAETVTRLQKEKDGKSILASQFIDEEAAAALIAGDNLQFLKLRAAYLLSDIQMFCDMGAVL